MNKKYRGVDATTDVLSFPADSECSLYPAGEDGQVSLGEIIIDINHIAELDESKDTTEEITKVFIHGLLHLLGFDHLSTRQQQEMTLLEKKVETLLKQEGHCE